MTIKTTHLPGRRASGGETTLSCLPRRCAAGRAGDGGDGGVVVRLHFDVETRVDDGVFHLTNHAAHILGPLAPILSAFEPDDSPVEQRPNDAGYHIGPRPLEHCLRTVVRLRLDPPIPILLGERAEQFVWFHIRRHLPRFPGMRTGQSSYFYIDFPPFFSPLNARYDKHSSCARKRGRHCASCARARSDVDVAQISAILYVLC